MKKRVYVQLFFLGMLALTAHSYGQKQLMEWPESYLRENIAFTDFRGREISSTSFVYELKVTDFKKTVPLPAGFGLNGKVFSDDGQGNDKVRGDGIYTSHETFLSSAANAKIRAESLSIVDQSFRHGVSLRQAQTESSVEDVGPGIKCKFRKCGCPCTNGKTCYACKWWGWQCVEIVECEVEIGF